LSIAVEDKHNITKELKRKRMSGEWWHGVEQTDKVSEREHEHVNQQKRIVNYHHGTL
jgi:hypothetical protein